MPDESRRGRVPALLPLIRSAFTIERGLPRLLLVLLLVGDALCIALYLWFATTDGQLWFLHLGAENGWGEAYQHLKQVWAVVLLAVAWWAVRSPVLLAWLAVVGYFFADDTFGIHEGIGRWVVDNYLFAPGFGDQRSQLVEALWMAGVGTLLAALVVLTHRRSDAAERADSWRLAVLFALLVGVGVLADGVGLAVEDTAWLRILFVVVEDGGELLVFSVVTALLLALAGDRTTLLPHPPVER